MRPTLKSALICFITAPALAIAATGDGKDKYSERKPTQATDCCRLSDVVGAKVSMMPGAKAVNEAAKEASSPDRPVGKITDVLLDCCSGTTKWAVVSFDKTLGFGGKTVAVPCDQLSWNKLNECFDLEQTDDQLKALPTFNCDDAKKNGLDLSVASLATYWPSSATSRKNDNDKNDEPKKADKLVVDGKQFECAAPHLVTAKDMMHTAVYAGSEKFGVIADGLVDHANHGVAFVIVSHGGTLGVGDQQYLIPYYALCMHSGDQGKEQVYSVNHTTKELEAGVRYQKPKDCAVDAEAIRRADEMFTADLPQHKTAKQ